MALLTYATLRTDYLPDIASGDTGATAVLGRALDRAEALVSQHLGYPGTSPTWASTSYTLRLTGPRVATQRLLLPVAPVTAITSVHQDLDLAFGAATEVASTQYELEALRNGAYLNILPTATTIARWYTQSRAIRVVCTAGYANEAAIPKDLAHAVYGWVADWWMKRRVRSFDNVSQSGSSQGVDKGIGITPLGAIPDDVREILSAYLLLSAAGGLS